VFATAALDAVLSVMPLDDFDATAVWCMEVVGAPTLGSRVEEFRSIIRRHEGAAVAMGKLERARFYDRARAATAIVVTGEGRLYGNLILRKGVVRLAL
jgi:L-fucose mutarotase